MATRRTSHIIENQVYAVAVHIRGTPWAGFLWGFLFGIVGLWILAMLSLMVPFIETIVAPLFWPGRWMASILQSDGSMGSSGVIGLFALNGVLYGVVGVGVQTAVRRIRK
jgi:hypothetical protein